MAALHMPKEWFLLAYHSPLILLVAVQTFFVVLGLTVLGFHLSWLDAGAAVGSAVATELILSRRRVVPVSALAAGLGIVIFMRASSPWFFVLAGVLAILSKYLIRWRSNHIFNPSNFAIVVLIFLLPYGVTVEFTQWGGDSHLYVALAALILGVAYRAGVLITTISFIVSYTGILLLLSTKYSLIYTAHHYGIIGPSFLLFASFMITDPKTSPTAPAARMLHGFSIAVLYFVLESIGIRYSLFFATFVITILNLFSRTFLWARVMRQFPANAITFGVVLALGGYILLPLILESVADKNRQVISLPFVLFGISQHVAGQCAPESERAFSDASEAIPTRAGWTSGVAWGDYNNDDFDDLFISRGHESRLLENQQGAGFTDVTASVGLDGLGSSSGFLIDYDNDGDRDLFAFSVDGDGEKESLSLRLFANEGGTFSDHTEQAGIAYTEPTRTSGTMTFGDVNNDGWLDVVTAVSGQHIKLNPNALVSFDKMLMDPFFPRTVTRVCSQNKVEPYRAYVLALAQKEGLRSEVEHLLQNERVCITMDHGLALFRGSSDMSASGPITAVRIGTPGTIRLFINEAGTFTERTEFLSILDERFQKPHMTSGRYLHPYESISKIFWQPVIFDYDQDGLQDIFFSIDNGANALLKNRGDGTFEDVTAEVGMDYSGTGMGVTVGDVNGDLLPDLFVNNVGTDYLYESSEEDVYENQYAEHDIGTLGVGWGTAFLDYDLDGWDDLVVTNGDTRKNPVVADLRIAQPLFRTDNLYRNRAGAGFEDVTPQLCSDLQSGYALAVSDYDNDGDPDVYVGNLTDHTSQILSSTVGDRLYQNDTTGQAYLRVRLVGTDSNRMAVGAYVDLNTNGRTIRKYLTAGSSFYSQNSTTLLFGLGAEAGTVSLTVHWPSGATTDVVNVAVNQTIVIVEGE